MALERLAPLPGDGEEGEPSRVRRTTNAGGSRPVPAGRATAATGPRVPAETSAPPFGVSAEAFLAARGVAAEPLVPVSPARPRRARPDPAEALSPPVDLRSLDSDNHRDQHHAAAAAAASQAEPRGSRGERGKGRGKARGDGPRTWPTREEREARQQAQKLAQAAEVAADPVGVARATCLRLLEFAPRTRQELALALAKRDVPEEAAEQVLGRFADVGMIDDALFASMWVASRHRGRGLAGRALSQELRRKGVDDELVRAAVGELDPETEVQTARALVRRKLPSTRGLATEARIRRLAGMLARKGYSAGTAFRVVKQELEREGTDPPDLAFDALQSLED